MNGVQTRFKCKLDVKRCKRFVFPPSSLLPRSNALKTKAIRYFQTDRTLTRIVSPPLHKEFMLRNNKVIILSRILISYSFIALALTCFGLFGISWYAVRHRTREIAIRKVHGASNWEIVWLLNRSFLWQILVAYIIAIPITWLLMQHWLEQFAYRISATQWNFLTPVLIVLVITTITITIHSYLSARTNPVNSLKAE